MDYDSEFYNGPSEFDEQVEEFKKSLMTSVKTEYIEKMEKLQKENAELQEVKKHLKQIKADYENKTRELEAEKQNAKYEAKKMRLSELMKDYQIAVYSPTTIWFKNEKCSLCDENRKIEYTTPRGKKFLMSCECDTNGRTYIVGENIVYSLSLKSDNTLNVYYKLNNREQNDQYLEFENYFGSKRVVDILTECSQYEGLKINDTYFANREDCQKYCDWLNEKEKPL